MVLREQDDETDDPSLAPMQRGLSDGIVIANRIIVVCLCLVFPLLGGWWIGGRFGSEVVGLVLGLVFGMAAAGFQLISLVKWLGLREKVRKAESGLDSASGRQRTTIEPQRDLEPEVDPWEQRWSEKWGEQEEGETDGNGKPGP